MSLASRTSTNYELLFDHLQLKLSHMIFWKDTELRYQGCNQLFLDLLNLESEESLIGRTNFDPDWNVPALTEAILLFHEPVAIEYRAVTHNSATLHFPGCPAFFAHIDLIPLVKPGESVLHGIMGVITDASPDKRVCH